MRIIETTPDMSGAVLYDKHIQINQTNEISKVTDIVILTNEEFDKIAKAMGYTKKEGLP